MICCHLQKCKKMTFMLLFALTQAYAKEKPVTVAYGSWEPFFGKDLKNLGSINEVVRAAFEKKGYKVTFKFMPWARAEQMVKLGSFDLTVSYLKTKSRVNEFIFSKHSISKHKTYFYKKKGNTKVSIKAIEDSVKYSIGMTRGYHYSDEFEQFIKRHNLRPELSNSDIIGLRKIIKGRIEIYPVEEFVADYQLKKMGLQNQAEPEAYLLAQTLNYAMFHKNTKKEILVDFDKGLEELVQEGKFTEYITLEK